MRACACARIDAYKARIVTIVTGVTGQRVLVRMKNEKSAGIRRENRTARRCEQRQERPNHFSQVSTPIEKADAAHKAFPSASPFQAGETLGKGRPKRETLTPL
jgi:hypothetical protein